MRSTDPRPSRRLLHFVLPVATLIACAHHAQKYDLVIPPPPEPTRYRLEFIYSGSSDYDEGSKAADLLLGKKSAAENHNLFKPFGVVSDGKGLVYVSDTAKPPRVEVFDDVKKQVRLIGAEGEGRLVLPLGMALDPSGDLYVADAKQRTVFHYGGAGAFKGTFGSKDTLERPTAVAVDSARGLLYVCDTGGHRVQVYDLAGAKLIRTIGKRGNGPGELNYPEGVTVGKDGRVYVVDALNFRYQVFDADGKFLATHGQIGQEPGAFARPKGIALDSDGHVYVSDAAFCNVQVFDDQGRLLIWIGGPGAAPGQFQLTEGVFVDAADRVFVVDQMNKRVQRYHYLADKPSTPGAASAATASAATAPAANGPAANAPAANAPAATAPAASPPTVKP
jgi:sugar lactone lactonase YvrE